MKKSKKPIKPEASIYRNLLDYEIKRAVNQSTRDELQKQRDMLKGRKYLKPEEVKKVRTAIDTASEKRAEKTAREWERKKAQSMEQLEKKIATSESYKKGGWKDWDTSDRERFADIQHNEWRKTATADDYREIMRRMLGIGSRGIELSDGSTFTQDEFNNILDRYGIDISSFDSTEQSIAEERYTQLTYRQWKQDISTDIDELLNKPDLTPREREGLRKMFKVFGT